MKTCSRDRASTLSPQPIKQKHPQTCKPCTLSQAGCLSCELFRVAALSWHAEPHLLSHFRASRTCLGATWDNCDCASIHHPPPPPKKKKRTFSRDVGGPNTVGPLGAPKTECVATPAYWDKLRAVMDSPLQSYSRLFLGCCLAPKCMMPVILIRHCPARPTGACFHVHYFNYFACV